MINTLTQVKKHLRLSALDTSEDDLLLLYMGAAEQNILDMIDATELPGASDSPPTPVPFPLQAAHLLIVAGLYENRESENAGGSGQQVLDNPAVKRLINPYRNLGV